MEIKFSQEECNDIITYAKTLPMTESRSLYNAITRKYSFRVLLYNYNTKWIFDKVYKKLYEDTGVEVKKTVEEFYIHNYVEGDYFVKHKDVPTKIWNVGVCLNDNYEGGEFVLHNPTLVLPKEAGSIYCFESQREHEVLPITKGERWSIIGFLERGHIGVNKPTQLL